MCKLHGSGILHLVTAYSCGELRVNLLNRKWTGFVLGSGIFCSSLNYIALLGHLSLLDMHIAGFCGFFHLAQQEEILIY